MAAGSSVTEPQQRGQEQRLCRQGSVQAHRVPRGRAPQQLHCAAHEVALPPPPFHCWLTRAQRVAAATRALCCAAAVVGQGRRQAPQAGQQWRAGHDDLLTPRVAQVLFSKDDPTAPKKASTSNQRKRARLRKKREMQVQQRGQSSGGGGDGGDGAAE